MRPKSRFASGLLRLLGKAQACQPPATQEPCLHRGSRKSATTSVRLDDQPPRYPWKLLQSFLRSVGRRLFQSTEVLLRGVRGETPPDPHTFSQNSEATLRASHEKRPALLSPSDYLRGLSTTASLPPSRQGSKDWIDPMPRGSAPIREDEKP